MKYLAHVKWFVEENSVQPNAFSAGEWLAVVIIVISGYVIARSIQKFWQQYDQQIDRRFKDLRRHFPAIIGIVTGLSLVAASTQGYVFAPNIVTDLSWLVVLQAVVGVLLIIGLWARAAAIGVIGLCALLFLDNSLVNLLEHLEYLAGAFVVLRLGRGSFSLIPSKSPAAEVRDTAVKHYVQIVGISLAILALSEKLAAPALAEGFLNGHEWNLLSGFGVSDRNFALLLGSIEFIFGMLLILGVVPRLVVLAILGAMVTTAGLLGLQEVFGHLFAVALVFVVWIGYNPVQKTRSKQNM